MKPRYCKHGNDVSKYLCPECDADAMRKRQKLADRRQFRAQLRKIRGVR